MKMLRTVAQIFFLYHTETGHLLPLIDPPLTDTLQTAASICMRGTQAEPQTWLLLEKHPREEAKRFRVT